MEPFMAIAKDLRETRAKLVSDARALVDKPNPTAEDNAAFDTLMEKGDEIKAQIDRLERAELLDAEMSVVIGNRARTAGISTDQAEHEAEIENSAFNKFMRFGASSLNDAERAVSRKSFQNAQSTTTTAGGYTVPTGFYRKLIDAQLAYGGMLAVSEVLDTDSGQSLPIPTDNDTANVGAIISENTQVSNQDITFGQVTLGAFMYSSKAVLVSLQLLQDSAFDLDAFIANKLATRIARITNAHFTTGAGTTVPRGVVLDATSGKVGLTGQTTSIIYDDLIDLEHSVDPAYRQNARFMMNDSSLKVIKKLKDSYGRPLWLAGLASNDPDTINGYPYVINQQVASMAANAKSVLFGDFKNYYIRRVNGAVAMRLTERYADCAQVGFMLWQRFDGALVDAGTHPIAYYANSAT
jgi:HK97 family phage major capsid protein